jgi:hypothetical protein
VLSGRRLARVNVGNDAHVPQLSQVWRLLGHDSLLSGISGQQSADQENNSHVQLTGL